MTDFNSLTARLRERLPHIPQRHIHDIVMEDDTIITVSHDYATTTSLPEPRRFTSMAQLWFRAKTISNEEDYEIELKKLKKAYEELNDIEHLLRSRRKEGAFRQHSKPGRILNWFRSPAAPTEIDIESLYANLHDNKNA